MMEKTVEKTIIRITDLSKTFSNESVQQHVLKNLNLTIREGDFTVIMGNSGSGKSTLLYALSGMDKPTLGKIECMGEDITAYRTNQLAKFRREHVGFVFQQNYLNDTMSAMDNVMVCGLLTETNRKKVRERAMELFAMVGIAEADTRKFPTQLSGGQQQRVALVRGLINKPALLFADEPTGALNSEHARHVLDLLTKLNEQGQSIVMVTHSVAAARRGNRLLYLADGVITDELTLGQYQPKDDKRHETVRNFLKTMGW